MIEQETGENWQVWYQDTFDWEAPRQVDIAGEGLENGLFELWQRHIIETVLADGGQGFARFNLWWVEAGKSVGVVGDWEAQRQLRSWLFDIGDKDKRPSREVLDKEFLRMIARGHAALVRGGETSERLLDKVLEVGSKGDFTSWLGEMD